MTISRSRKENRGKIRKTFLASMLSMASHWMSILEKGGFLIDDGPVLEVHGMGKGLGQVWDVKNSYLAMDDIARGFSGKIPL